jgi:hypothetical protein
MLDFSFSPAQDEFRAGLREIALAELLPRYQTGDAQQIYPAEQVKRILAFSNDFWAGREAERDLISVGITAEEVARGDFNAVLMSLGPSYTRHFLADASPALLERWLPGDWNPVPGSGGDDGDSREGLRDHVILAGFGPSGQQVGESLLQIEQAAIVLDLRPANVELARSMGLGAALGDASNLDVLLHHGIAEAKVIVITVPDHRASTQIVAAVRTLAPGIQIIVRARYHPFVSDLERAGATFVIDEEYHTGRRLAAAMRMCCQ